MKTQSQLFSTLTRSTLLRLTTVVDETLALEVKPNRVFSAADLWNIQRKSRTMMSRRRLVR